MSRLLEQPALIEQLQQNLSFQTRTRSADAAVLIAITQEQNPQILLTRRAAQMRTHGGEVSFPGGKREKSDTSNIVVALREAHEETALNPYDVSLLGELPMQKARSGMLVKPIVGLIQPEISLIPEPSEIDRIFYMPLQEFMLSTPQAYHVKYAEQSLYFPSIQFDNEVVWGLTARILVSLLQRGLGYHKEWPFLLNPPR
ncbi:CoA pyrophosphatase [Acinetobacter puyangensis]|jgi:NTP pyrophosphohydrolases including oxidative damage repair enzymes|uniref:NUDIX domain-containing protein n=1 Tax=Acinetobacter puyangensis TaxID=1096779 RepID=A0A240E5R9_9GAMM|nr:NUDIX domain-containing protein [Acinetobacter puyangensis]